MTPIEQAAQALREAIIPCLERLQPTEHALAPTLYEQMAAHNALNIARAALASLEAAKQEPPGEQERELMALHEDLAAKQHQFVRETLRTSESAELLRKWMNSAHAKGCTHEPWPKACSVCDLMRETKALLDKPINAPKWPRQYTEEEGDAYMHGWFDGNDAPKARAAPADQPTSQEAREYPPLPRPFVPSGSCTCKGPYGPCESCHENEQAWREWMDEPNLSPREARAYVDADRKARQQEALDALRELVAALDAKGPIERLHNAMGTARAAIAKGERQPVSSHSMSTVSKGGSHE